MLAFSRKHGRTHARAHTHTHTSTNMRPCARKHTRRCDEEGAVSAFEFEAMLREELERHVENKACNL